MPNLLVVDDDLSMREMLEVMLTSEGYNVECSEDGTKALRMLEKKNYDLILCDIKMSSVGGLEVLREAKNRQPQTVVIMISAFATTQTAVEAMKIGAYDFIPKPFKVDEVKQTIRNALDRKTLEYEKEILDAELKKTYHFGRIVGNSPAMMKIYNTIKQVSDTKTNVLITGESGTGKELIARAIHENSVRKHKPFTVIHCGGIPETLMESELFGHKKGAFTGAIDHKQGLFEASDGGTVFLDEVAELTPAIQVKILRVVQEKAFKPVGKTRDVEVDVRIISATNKNLEEEVIAGNFREDLFYRLNVIHINVPPLRERMEDLPPLARHFLEKYASEMGKSIHKLSSYALDMLTRYDFPGNVRELENMIERSVAMATTNIILPESLALSTYKRGEKSARKHELLDFDVPPTGLDLDAVIADVERGYLLKALEMAGGVKQKAAKLLGISIESFRYRFDKHHLDASAKEESKRC
ncbi:MAG: sigma-54-dependent Fis family transcriptional regulator [Deltaproteobacteria bacterium]|nr:sigma-54-dependent Fis family transcriptional regulator [Deltaproteobacteria bacterium]MBW2018472.1 sigma-54-dependent Fis family transcriptional regulator [Deltaproteobacteria bacterium]MBW2074129.1 sigma-54-dependent Fis family transcriptional regulator [Deltaproteobacteria bacterium]